MMRAMPKPPRPWIVTPHDPIVKLEDNLWAVDGEVPGMTLRRRMAIARRADGTLVFFNAVPVGDEALAAIRGFGQPAVLIVPNSFHRLDIHAFRERLGVKLHCGAGAEKRVRAVAPVDGRVEDLAGDAAVSLVPIEGTRSGETAMIVRSGARASVVFSDAFMNLPRSLGLLTTIMRTAGGPKCPPLFRLAMVKDRRAVRASLERLADTPGLTRLVPSHGDVFEGDAAATLRQVATRDLG
jgi:hypothetical protein